MYRGEPWGLNHFIVIALYQQQHYSYLYSLFGLPVKFGPLIKSSGTYYLVIWILFIRSSCFGLMYLSQNEPFEDDGANLWFFNIPYYLPFLAMLSLLVTKLCKLPDSLDLSIKAGASRSQKG